MAARGRPSGVLAAQRHGRRYGLRLQGGGRREDAVRGGGQPGGVSLKIPGVPADPRAAAERVAEVRAAVPAHVGVRVSGDAFGAAGLIAGCDTWYSVIAGTLSEPAVRITRAVRKGRPADALAQSERLAPLWELFARHGSLRATAAAAEHLGLAAPGCLPRPLLGLGSADRAEVAGVVDRLFDGEPATHP